MVRKRALRGVLSLFLALLLASSAVAISASTPGTSQPESSDDGAEADGGEGSGEGAGSSCDQRLYDAHEQIRAWYEEAAARWHAWSEEQSAEARALAGRNASEGEWREAHEHWSAAAEAVQQEVSSWFWSMAWEHLGDCAERLSEPRMEWEASWSHESGWSEPEHGEAAPPQPQPVPPPYIPAPEPQPHPMAADPAWQALEAEAARIHEECQARMEALWREAESGGAHEPDGAWRERALEAERACAEQVRALYDSYYREEHQDFEDRFGSLRMAWSDDEQRIVVTGRFLELRGDPEQAVMERLACRGPEYVDRLAADGFLAEFRPEETGSGTALRVFDDHGGVVFDLHDNERCTLNLSSTDAVPVTSLDLADRLDCEQGDDGGLDCRDGDLRVVVLVHEGRAELGAGNELTVQGRATFLVSAPPRDEAPERAADRAAYEEAVLQKRVGAEVRIGRGEDGLTVASAPIGDLEVRVTGGLSGIDVFVESAQGEGKTLSLAVDRALLQRALPSIEAYAVEPDGEHRIEVRMAESLADVLDPLDDGEAVKYWFSEEDGASVVLVSIPHFSEKRIHIAPDLLGSVGIPAPGLAWLVPGLGLAVVAARRRV